MVGLFLIYRRAVAHGWWQSPRRGALESMAATRDWELRGEEKPENEEEQRLATSVSHRDMQAGEELPYHRPCHGRTEDFPGHGRVPR